MTNWIKLSKIKPSNQQFCIVAQKIKSPSLGINCYRYHFAGFENGRFVHDGTGKFLSHISHWMEAPIHPDNLLE